MHLLIYYFNSILLMTPLTNQNVDRRFHQVECTQCTRI